MSSFLARLGALLAAIFDAVFGRDEPIKPPPAAPAAPVAPPSVGDEIAAVTAVGVYAVEKVFGPLVDSVRGKNAIADDKDALNLVLNAVATLDPAAAPAIGFAEAAEPVVLYLLGLLTGGQSAFAPAPRGGPPITEADWSNGPPQAQPNPNPSGRIGGPAAS